MTIYISPEVGVEVITSSIGNLMPVNDINYDRSCYFIFYSHGANTEPWNFWIELKVN